MLGRLSDAWQCLTQFVLLIGPFRQGRLSSLWYNMPPHRRITYGVSPIDELALLFLAKRIEPGADIGQFLDFIRLTRKRVRQSVFFDVRPNSPIGAFADVPLEIIYECPFTERSGLIG